MSDVVEVPEQGPGRLIGPIPPGSRLLHIGIPKSGTTSLQYAASANRAELFSRGVRYPGSRDQPPAGRLFADGSPVGLEGMGASTPSPKVWQTLLDEVEADPERRSLHQPRVRLRIR